MPRHKTPVETRFWKYVRKTRTCWLWTAATDGHGYGVIGAGSKREGLLKAHRVSWQIHYGQIPPGLNVCHKCDVPACVNPGHLFVGTDSDNARDAISKGRFVFNRAHGSAHKNSKLTEESVAAARLAYACAPNKRGLIPRMAVHLGVSGPGLRNAISGKTWKHVQASPANTA